MWYNQCYASLLLQSYNLQPMNHPSKQLTYHAVLVAESAEMMDKSPADARISCEIQEGRTSIPVSNRTRLHSCHDLCASSSYTTDRVM